MSFKQTLLPLYLLSFSPLLATTPVETDSLNCRSAIVNESETEGITFRVNPEKTDNKTLKAMQPGIRLGGYIMGKYSISDRRGEKTNGGFDLRFLRIYADGTVFKDFYYKFQFEFAGAPGSDTGPRILDAFIEWQKFDFMRLKFGQFKRSFGFENPMGPMTVGYGTYSQATMKLASIGDRCGEHSSGGRDLGFQVQGDIFPSSDGHKWLHYQLGVFNGQGINHRDVDHFKDVIGGIWISPIKDLQIGGFGWNGKYTNEKYDMKNPDPKHQVSVKRVRWGVGLKYENDWSFRAEYMNSRGGVATDVNRGTRSDAWYATLGVPAVKGLKFYGRYDCYRDNLKWNSLRTDYGLSANYTLGKNLFFQLNYTFTDDRFARNYSPIKDSHYNTFDIQVTARF